MWPVSRALAQERVRDDGQGLERLQALFPLEAEMVPKSRQRAEVASDAYEGGIVYPRHGGLNPAKWVDGIMRASMRAGALVQGQTPVLGLRGDRGAHVAKTPRGSVRAGDILVATNGYTSEAPAGLSRRIVPIPSFIVATEHLGQDRIAQLLPTGRMIVETRYRHCYYRPSPDRTRIVFGGRAAMFEAPRWLVEAELRGLLRGIFPELGDVAFTHSWRGRTGFTFCSLPHVGRLNGIWHAMGYSGNGNAMAPYLGHKAALQIIGDPDGETAYSKTEFPLRWWHPGWSWFLPFADVTFRVRDIWENARKNK